MPCRLQGSAGTGASSWEYNVMNYLMAEDWVKTQPEPPRHAAVLRCLVAGGEDPEGRLRQLPGPRWLDSRDRLSLPLG